MKKVVWGILGTAKIAKVKVIPAMQKSTWIEVRGIASRSDATARLAAAEFGIPRAYGSYEELLADPEIEAVYNPLPNHLHVAFMMRFHPQWLRARELVSDGRIGEPRVVHVFFSYFNADPANIRNQCDSGGGALYDIGCYGIVAGRFLFEMEPRRAAVLSDRDPA